ncbi:hypothetical protein [Fontibacillus sp. BL9]
MKRSGSGADQLVQNNWISSSYFVVITSFAAINWKTSIYFGGFA